MKIALAQINTIVGDFAGNLQKIGDYLKQAEQQKADLVIFPELAICGYPPKDLLDRVDFIENNLQALKQLQRKVRQTAVVVGYVDRNQQKLGRPLHNALALLHRGKILFRYHKRLLPNYDVFDENRYFEPGQEKGVFTFKNKRIGFSICEDLWADEKVLQHQLYDEDPIASQVAAGVDLLINISASPFSLGKPQWRLNHWAKKICKWGVPLIYVNLVGGNDDLVFDGTSLVLNARGQVVVRAPSFAEDSSLVNTDRLQAKTSLYWPSDASQALDALVLGLKDYIVKCGFKRVVLGLSGGIDSALVAWIATQAIGADNVLGVALPSKFNSPESLADALQLAKNLGIQFIIIPIHDVYDVYKKVLGYEEGSRLGLTLQNVQARIRGNLLMALSNEEGRLLLTTGNKSELAMGYCTLYGDMAGGFAVIADVPKTLVYRVAREANHRHHAIPNNVFRKAPSAELAFNQKDEDDLPPYKKLDPILNDFILKEVDIHHLAKQYHDGAMLEKILNRVDRNEYKRMQMPPGIRITTKAFGSGRRVPIAHRFVHRVR